MAPRIAGRRAGAHGVTDLRSALGGILPTVRPVNAPVRMLLAAPSHEWHEFGVLIAAVFASIAKIEPIYLGVNLPSNEIILAAKHVNPRIITLGVSMGSAAFDTQLTDIVAGIAPTTNLWLRGRASRRPRSLEIWKAGPAN